MVTKVPSKKYPVVEIFGPTIQGEGEHQGKPCHFIRFGGCDYKCEWCDTPHAVLPHLVRQVSRLTHLEILDQVFKLSPGPKWVVLSGGNPCLHDLGDLIVDLHVYGRYFVALETQGTRIPRWIPYCQSVAVSPKPPSSGHTTDFLELQRFLSNCPKRGTFLKIVVFDQLDYDFAKKVHLDFSRFPLYLSAGNDAGQTVGNPGREDTRSDEKVALDLINRGRWLANRVMVDEQMNDVTVQMQQHVLFWGNQRGR